MYTDSDEDTRDTNLDLQFGSKVTSFNSSDDIYQNQSPNTDSEFSELQSPPRFGYPNTENLIGTPISKAPPRTDYQSYNPTPEIPELKSLFALISKFQPEPVDLPPRWKPFLPELQPAIGAIDAFIKIPRPDGELDPLGLVILDEPSIAQSNPQIMKMELREKYGTGDLTLSDSYIGEIKDLDKNTKALEAWLDSIEEIHRNRPPPNFIYSVRMPEIESLMEPWEDIFEEVLKTIPLPGEKLDVTLEEYVRIICAIIGIPVKGNIIESLHHLFVLYSQFEGNQYFQSQSGD